MYVNTLVNHCFVSSIGDYLLAHAVIGNSNSNSNRSNNNNSTSNSKSNSNNNSSRKW